MSMNEDRFAGTAKNVGGRVEQGFGRATGDMKTEVEGKIKQATGAAQDVYGQAKTQPGRRMSRRKMPLATRQGPCRNTLHHWKSFCANAIESRPYTSVAVALGVGWFIGRMGGRSDYWER